MEPRRRILYLGYWGIADVLTVSSVFPTLRALSAIENVEAIFFCSIERGEGPIHTPIELPPKVKHVALRSLQEGGSFITKLYDFVVFPIVAWRLISNHKINTIICRSSLAGGMLLSVARWKGLPVIVESFEPHSDYMVESGVWERTAFRTRWSARMESRLKAKALFLLPVSENYKKQLIAEGISPDRIRVVPCTVQAAQFSFNPTVRERIRKQWGWTGLTVGIYIGKFGGIYYEAEAFEQFREAFRFFGSRFALIILSAQDDVTAMVDHYMPDVDRNRVRVLSVPHDKVSDYLDAADFAFSTIKPAPSRRFCSPIKHGEYWANGLPILVEEGIGDDSEIIANEGGGVILHRPDYKEAWETIDSLIKNGRAEIYQHMRGLAIKYRNENIIESTYRSILR